MAGGLLFKGRVDSRKSTRSERACREWLRASRRCCFPLNGRSTGSNSTTLGLTSSTLQRRDSRLNRAIVFGTSVRESQLHDCHEPKKCPPSLGRVDFDRFWVQWDTGRPSMRITALSTPVPSSSSSSPSPSSPASATAVAAAAAAVAAATKRCVRIDHSIVSVVGINCLSK